MSSRSGISATRIFGTVAILTLAACATLQPKLEMPKVVLEGIEIDQLGSDRVLLKVDLQIDNPNERDVTVDALDFTLDVAGVRVGSASLPRAIVLAAHRVTLAELGARTSVNDLARAFDAALREGDWSYELAGTIIVNGQRWPFIRQGKKNLRDLRRDW